MAKDIKRFSHSRLSTFKQCPLKHWYEYVEQIETGDSSSTIPGSLFHKAMELYLDDKDMDPAFEEWDKECMKGTLNYPVGLLKTIVDGYLAYYAKEFSRERCLAVEKEYQEYLDEDGNFIELHVDEILQDKGMTIVRDRKTALNKLKYTEEDVRYNQQLLLYVPFVENDLKVKVDAIEIDEVRIAVLGQVPTLKNGKPTTNKGLLDLVTYDAYYNFLKERGLENDKEFKSILDYLEERGHPLYRRIRIPLIDRVIIDTNAQEFLDTYETCKRTVAENQKFRTKGPLCNYCAYSKLCKLDYFNPDTSSRNAMIQSLKVIK